MERVRNIPVTGTDGRTFLLDVTYPAHQPVRGRIVFLHGFKGFKDWGHWSLIAEHFARAGYLFAAFNFSHNGTTPAAPAEFRDLDAFGANTFSKELTDLEACLDWLDEQGGELENLDSNREPFTLIGHSRGGPIALIKAHEDNRVNYLITWASVASLDYAWPDQAFLDQWQKDGQYTVVNGRTGQEMPLYYSLYEDYLAAGDRLQTRLIAPRMAKPWLIQHGTADPAVTEAAARQLAAWSTRAELHLIEGADHVFGASHPYESDQLPVHSQQLLDRCLSFLEEQMS
jgi:uncharacterized protein